MFLLYLKSHIKTIFVFLLLSLIFAIVFSLYNLPIEAVLYSVILSIAFFIVFASFDYFKFYKKHKTLQNLLYSINIDLNSLPNTYKIIEKDYQNLIKSLYKHNKDSSFQFDNEKSELLDYYTLWAHQIKTPISAMNLLLQGDSFPKNSDLSVELFKIEQYVNMVLQYLRLDSTSTDFSFKEYNLDDIIKGSLRKYSKIFITKKISLDYSDINKKVLTDKKWLQFVIEQILSNGLKYTSKGKISIFLEDIDSNVLIIQDTGIGISEEDLPRIWEKGFTGYNGRINKRSTGIGLYLCKKIINKLSHKITIESTMEKGTKVKIDFSINDIVIE